MPCRLVRLVCVLGVCFAVAVTQGQHNTCPAVVTTQPACATYCTNETFRCHTSGPPHTAYAPAAVWSNDAGTQWCKCQCCEKPLGICGPNDQGPQVYYTQQCQTHTGSAPTPPPPPPPPHDAPEPPPPCANAGVINGATCAAKCGGGRSAYKSVDDAGQCDCNGRRLCGDDLKSSGGGTLKFIFVVSLIAAVCGGVAVVARRRRSKQGTESKEALVSGF